MSAIWCCFRRPVLIEWTRSFPTNYTIFLNDKEVSRETRKALWYIHRALPPPGSLSKCAHTPGMVRSSRDPGTSCRSPSLVVGNQVPEPRPDASRCAFMGGWNVWDPRTQTIGCWHPKLCLNHYAKCPPSIKIVVSNIHLRKEDCTELFIKNQLRILATFGGLCLFQKQRVLGR